MNERIKNIYALLYKKDGGKITLYLPYLYWGSGILFGVFVVFQLCLPQSERLSAPEAIAAPELHAPSLSFPTQIERAEPTEREKGTESRARRIADTYSGPQLVLRPRNLATIQPGTMLEAVLITGASNGLVKAKAKERLAINGETLIESGTLLIGQGTSSEERLSITFQQAVFADGTMGKINAIAADISDKIPGIKGSAWANKTVSVAGSIGLGFVGGLSEGLQETHGQQGVLVKAPTWKNALLHATSATALEQSRNVMQGLKDHTPPIEIAPNTTFIVIFGGAP